jgi:hypothetical protein
MAGFAGMVSRIVPGKRVRGTPERASICTGLRHPARASHGRGWGGERGEINTHHAKQRRAVGLLPPACVHCRPIGQPQFSPHTPGQRYPLKET